MLLVIFGAGASYDSIPDEPPPASSLRHVDMASQYRPPLAKDLFGDLEYQMNALRKYTSLPVLAAQVRAALPPGLEEVLTRYAKSADAATNDDIRRHMVRNLVDLRTYIYEVIQSGDLSQTWSGCHERVT